MNNIESVKTIIEVEFFIIPNSIFHPNNYTSGSEDYINNLYSKEYRLIGDFYGTKVPQNESRGLVQIWTTSSDCNNWGDHGIPKQYEHLELKPRCFNKIPYEIVRDIKERDVLTVETSTFIIRMTANQQSYRYGNFGNFEDAVTATLR